MHNRTYIILVVLAILTLSDVSLFSVFAVDTLNPSDFKLESWSKTVDFFDYARLYAATHGKTPPPASSHANLYLTYVNTKGMQMVYGGLVNITDGLRTVTLPMQSWMMHYKSNNGSKDLVAAASFIMLLAFGENATTKYADSPDMNDTLFASFNVGFDLTSRFGSETPPGLSSRITIIPLSASQDKLNWHWGMKYTNLTAIWWETSMDPLHPRQNLIAFTRYDELTFTYDLILDPIEGTATLTANYIIGKITDLWLFNLGWFGLVFPGLLSVHYNSSGNYWLNGRVKISSQNVYQFLWEKGIKMSIVQFQSTFVLDHTAYFNSNGANVNNTETNVGNSSIATTTEDNEVVFNADFGSKKTYNLYNFTEDPTEMHFKTYNATTRTAKVAGFANNPVFYIHTGLMRYIPLILANIDLELYQKAKDHLLDLSYADYFYIISYPNYSGYRIEHDPTYTAYYNAAVGASTSPNPAGAIFLLTIVAAIIASAILLVRRHRAKHQSNARQPNQPTPPLPPTALL